MEQKQNKSKAPLFLSLLLLLLSITAVVIGVFAFIKEQETQGCIDTQSCDLKISKLTATDLKTDLLTSNLLNSKLLTSDVSATTVKPLSTDLIVATGNIVVNGELNVESIRDNTFNPGPSMINEILVVNKQLNVGTYIETITTSKSINLNTHINYLLTVGNITSDITLTLVVDTVNNKVSNVKITSTQSSKVFNVNVNVLYPAGYIVKVINTNKLTTICESTCNVNVLTFSKLATTSVNMDVFVKNDTSKSVTVQYETKFQTSKVREIDYADLKPPYPVENGQSFCDINLNNSNLSKQNNYYLLLNDNNFETTNYLNLRVFIGRTGTTKEPVVPNTTWRINLNVLEFANKTKQNSVLFIMIPENYTAKLGFIGNSNLNCVTTINGFCPVELLQLPPNQSETVQLEITVERNNVVIINVLQTNSFNSLIINDNYKANQITGTPVNTTINFEFSNFNYMQIFVDVILKYDLLFKKYKTLIIVKPDILSTVVIETYEYDYFPFNLIIGLKTYNYVCTVYITVDDSIKDHLAGLRMNIKTWSTNLLLQSSNNITIRVNNNMTKTLFLQGKYSTGIINQTLTQGVAGKIVDNDKNFCLRTYVILSFISGNTAFAYQVKSNTF